MKWLLSLLGAGGIPQALTRAYEAKLNAANDHERLEADKLIERIESARAIALAEAGDRYSATRIGRLLIVVPFGLWWAAIFIVSTLHLDFVVQAIPGAIMDMAKILVPAIVIASVVEKR